MDQAAIDTYQLVRIPQSEVDNIFIGPQSTLYGCDTVYLNNAGASLSSMYNTWTATKWPKTDQSHLMLLWAEYFGDMFAGELSSHGFHITDNVDLSCLTVSMELFNIKFGRQGHTTDHGSFRNHAGFELPLYSASLRIVLREPTEDKIVALVLDNQQAFYPIKGPYAFEVDPEDTQAIIKKWAASVTQAIADAKRNR